MNRILVIRGGAIGDFVLTLPAIKLLRDRFPRAYIEILGSKLIVALAEKRFYADATRSIESAPLARFFVKDSALAPALINYFSGFDLILSYLYDPDGIFETNLKRCGSKTFIAGAPKFSEVDRAVCQLARPLERLGLKLKDHAARIFPSAEDREFARDFVGANRAITALHPGSGGERKNWPIENWLELGTQLLSTGCNVLVVCGEADEDRARILELAWKKKTVRFAKHLPLPHLAAVLENAVFVGHDSGISHIAAAVGARCILLFGPTDADIWAPQNQCVTVLRAPGGDLQLLNIDTVIAAIENA